VDWKLPEFKENLRNASALSLEQSAFEKLQEEPEIHTQNTQIVRVPDFPSQQSNPDTD
jgi:hypothetical protein